MFTFGVGTILLGVGAVCFSSSIDLLYVSLLLT